MRLLGNCSVIYDETYIVIEDETYSIMVIDDEIMQNSPRASLERF